MDSKRLLDEVGLRILRELQQDARLSHSELGRRVGLSQPAVAERIQRMEEAGIIRGYHVDLDLEKIGLPITAFIRVASSDVKSGNVDRLAEFGHEFGFEVAKYPGSSGRALVNPIQARDRSQRGRQ